MATDRFRRRPDQRPFVLGHRGARREAPENTFAALDAARRAGADGSELDVRLDGSGRVIVLHDRTLERVTGGKDARNVEWLTADEVEAARIEGEPIPTLSAVLKWAAQHDQLLNVEVKRDVSARRALVRGVIEALKAEPAAAARVILSSFDPAIVRALATALRDVPVAWLVHKGQRVLRGAPGFAWIGAAGVHPELPLATDARVARWKRGGALVNVWTVNEPADAQRLAAAGVDALISDVPGSLLSAL